MRLNIFTKLFVTILITAFAVLLCVILFMNWSFRTGFTDYQNQADRERAVLLVDVLVERYQQQGSWDFIRSDRRNWGIALAEIGEGRYANKPKGREDRGPPPDRPEEDKGSRPPPPGRGEEADDLPPPPGMGDTVEGSHRPHSPQASSPSRDLRTTLRGRSPPPPPSVGGGLVMRLRLLDQAGEVVIGRPGNWPDKEYLPISVNGEVVGGLEMERREVISDQLAVSFQQQQVQNAYWIALLAIGLSLLVAFLATRQFLRPVLRLTQGAKRLAQGDYATQIPVSTADELGDLAGHFNHLSTSLQRNEEMRAQWIADISHELRTPLAILRSEVEALLDGIRQPTTDRIRSLHAEILSLGKLVDDLYHLSLSDAGDRDAVLDILDVNGILSDVERSASLRLSEKSIRLTTDLAPQPLWVHGEDKPLRQLFSNMLENSYRYTDNGGQVRISSRVDKGGVLIKILDSTPGVPDEALPRLFDRLYRVDKSRSRALGGSGLGLSICKNIVEGLGGTIYAQHSPLGGLMVCIRFPLAAPDSKR